MIRNTLIAAIVLAAAWAAGAKNVDLVTLPRRDSVQLTIYNSEDITLVKETRYITVKRGANKLQFSWANTLIDPTSVEFRPLEQQEKIELADTVFPGSKPQHLIWNIDSKFEGQVKVQVSYFTSGLTWNMDYVSLCDPAEQNMQFRGYVRVYNNSGEQYENAQVRLIVGEINLVEKIAELARRYGIPVPAAGAPMHSDLRRKVALESMDRAEKAAFAAGGAGAVTDSRARLKAIVKEGISEYFMFTVEGTETIRNGWSKRMRAVKADEVKFETVYRMRSHQYGRRPVRLFIWRNDEEHKLGQCPLPNGRVRVFRDNGKDGLSFLGEQQIRYVPLKARIEVNLGPDDLVVYKTKKLSTERVNFHFRRTNKKEYVDGWNDRQQWADTIRNYRDRDIVFELRRIWDGDVDYESEVRTTLFDYRTTETKLTVKPRSTKEYPCTVVFHNGVNRAQSRVKLK